MSITYNNENKPVELQWTALESEKKNSQRANTKAPKKLKIAISRSNIKMFENEMEYDDLSSWGSLIPKISLLSKKTVAYKAYFAANFNFSTKPEVVFKTFENGDGYLLSILQSPYMPIFKSLICFVRSTGAFIFNRE